MYKDLGGGNCLRRNFLGLKAKDFENLKHEFSFFSFLKKTVIYPNDCNVSCPQIALR